MNDRSHAGGYTDELHDIEGDRISNDARLILEKGFAAITAKHDISDRLWPSKEDIDVLVERTGRLTIFATAVLNIVDSDRFSPKDRLAQILTQTSLTDAGRYNLVDEFYLNVLQMAARHTSGAEHADMLLCARLRVLTGTIVLLQNPLSIPALAQLADIPEDDVSRDVHALSAILQLGPDTADSGSPIVHIVHPSFRDFLLERCSDPRFLVNASQRHHDLSAHCLQILNQRLKYNICDIKDPTIPHSDVTNPGLSLRIRFHIPEALPYACQFWMSHIVLSGSPNADLLSVLRIFVSEHIFHWIEVLSLIGKLSFATNYLSLIAIWIQQHTTSTPQFDLCVMLNDSLKMLRRNHNIVKTHALQIYYSGYLSMPQCALLKVVQDQKHVHVPLLLSKRAPQWGDTILVIEGHLNVVWCVAPSPDGTKIASGSDDKTLRLWDACTGHEISVFGGHTGSVLSVAFSPDGTQIASGSSDKTVRLWDAHSGHEISKFEGHSSSVLSVALSPNGRQIVSGSGDNTIRLWDAHLGHEIRRFEGHSGLVFSVAYSPDGKQIASGSDDKTVRLWDAHSGHEVCRMEGHSDSVLSVAFSPDGTQIVSGSSDNAMRLWDVHSGLEISRFEGHTESITSVAFSADGTRIASGSSDKTARIWEAQSGLQIRVFQGHSDCVQSVAFSPDCTIIISGSSDKTVRLWEAHSERQICVTDGHCDRVRSIAFSPDGERITSGSDDKTTRLWDVRSGHQLAILEGLANAMIQSVAFSQDNLHVQVRYIDGSSQSWALADVAIDKTALNTSPTCLNLIPDAAESHDPSPSTLHYDQASGWIMTRVPRLDANQESVKLCWLPVVLRGQVYATHNENMIAIVSESNYQFTIIDFAPMLSMLRMLGVI